MSSTERKNFLQRRTSTAKERKAYRDARKEEQKAYEKSAEGIAEKKRILAAHAECLANSKSTD